MHSIGTVEDRQVFGMDTAKHVFQVYSVKPSTGASISVRLDRSEVVDYFARFGSCLIAMEACGGSNYWGRLLQSHGHRVRLLPTALIRPFITGNKTDAIDARAIWLAVQLPDVKFASIKTVAQQSVLSLHRQRDMLTKFRTRQVLALRGLIYEFGIIFPKGGRDMFLKAVGAVLETRQGELPEFLLASLQDQVERIRSLEKSIARIDEHLEKYFRSDPDMQRVAQIPGVGMLTATAVIATMGDPAIYKNGREFCAWLGLVPRQSGSGGRIRLLGISKKGDPYLRTLLIHGARSVLYRTKEKSAWLQQLLQRRPTNVVVVAQAAKTARIIWAVTAKKCAYDPTHALVAGQTLQISKAVE